MLHGRHVSIVEDVKLKITGDSSGMVFIPRLVKTHSLMSQK
jgi:hypothetical protein